MRRVLLCFRRIDPTGGQDTLSVFEGRNLQVLFEQLAEEEAILKSGQLGNLSDIQIRVEQHFTGGVEPEMDDILVRGNIHNASEQDIIP